ncbi:bifunctional adenosylcobinamide kinase/adenosylcobinamide-phosphate guanylyltransferase [Sulfitobacter geojensis]|uniref:Bifunctional adenosylcobalamin biosynthesis protein n=1 Tax=Sulfitobacter geojensis TaxID=1342299 RepID=A0AAE3B7R3_9RHOB|nr:bifunctional adenosylcobinamide kinase/adenosylcobinamide-phosphate guanylyltransferase [Sulfitobacter geojensis]MBM1690455.1 bifunctional adenosylcobinamide kinase/adenosylcobinamide-phosphate guanylyltransferase [Sulfitobacter geojensis]MBM1694521.1 bifunctional adenosylcobinamide kinase/adenosylcobinamide-phosphate guanylyltransferase [Sulfitobacter geojensis]MBM1706687.1 bifunctional adenosylcobinamide kinase/adenosylcobinamide-phosphate guanylyltransferase [Sulfitobacter geojensis]MBM17
MLPNSTFVLGGAASGKSFWAEELVKSYDTSMTYIATGQVFDSEVAAKVEIHKNRRDDRWLTVEEPFDLTAPLDAARPDQVILIDCATMWLTNHLMAQHDIGQAQATLLTALRRCAAPWVIVSNEVGQGIVPDNALARQFREAQGRLNIALAGEAELAVQVIAGLPLVLKGALP